MTMERLKKMEEREFSSLIRVLFGMEAPTGNSERKEDLEMKVEFVDPTLNDSQKEAIHFALGAREVALIHGPPGACHPALWKGERTN